MRSIDLHIKIASPADLVDLEALRIERSWDFDESEKRLNYLKNTYPGTGFAVRRRNLHRWGILHTRATGN